MAIDYKPVPMSRSNAKDMFIGQTMPTPKGERKRQIVAQRWAYGIKANDSKYIDQPKAKNLMRKVRVGKYNGLHNIDVLVKPNTVEPVNEVVKVVPKPVMVVAKPAKVVNAKPKQVHSYTKYVFRDPANVANWSGRNGSRMRVKLPMNYR